MPSIQELLREKGTLLADGATGTNLFAVGLASGNPPEEWNVTEPDKVKALHRSFVEAGADIILTNTFGANRHRLKLHRFEGRVREFNEAGVALAREVVAEAGRPVVIAGSVGPTGELFAPLGQLTYDGAVEAFREQIEALKQAGADVAWAETMSAPEEMKAAAEAAASVGMPFAVTASFDTAGKTMMGLSPKGMGSLSSDFACEPVALGSNCGVGASDLLAAVLEITEAYPDAVVIAKANCGIPEIRGGDVVYTGTPDLMARYVHLAMDAGVRIIGGCCGTSPQHVAAMRHAMDTHQPEGRPDVSRIVAEIGPLVAPPRLVGDEPVERRNRRRRG
ncbi:betaine--homocysteine S-methyltransferase [Stappia sp. F7233]|uniref:Betaine--homocysteine S-methyltransferase n=1 Tax=Stappia albiluteola TaxID=2758565 RepID=A0A839AHZ0_9HYPH|nr:betaine--homocysteine S-methyltransferase [Stappia albiluteola]MBA5779341.1 betaine--homocysteine S-methyltransferase [Stappia albiluteola]